MATSTSNMNNKKRDGVLSSLAPRTINVQKFSEARSSELESLHSIVSDRLNKDFRSKRNKRRRTNSYNNQSAKRRNIKRQRSESLTVSHQASSKGDNETKEKKIPRRVKRRMELKENPESGFVTSGDGTKRLRTHVWHAKRFTMTKLWGFHLPLGLHGRGRGSRDVLKQFKQNVLVHDASYHIGVQLEGPESSLLSILNVILEPSPSSHSKEVFDSILAGLSYENAMLYNVEPPVSHPIAPVIYMWRPERRDSDSAGTDSVEFRKIWVWIHASSFSDGYDSLKLACQKQMNVTGGVSVDCISLEGRLAKIEIFGPKASHLLQKTLHLATSNSEDSSVLRKWSVENSDSYNEENISSSCAILSRFVTDPRLIPDDTRDDSKSSPEAFKCLWDAKSELTPPEEENILCWEKHQTRMDSFCLDDSASEIPKLSSSRPRNSSRSCPLLLLKHKKLANSLTGWSLILPLSWIKVFWNVFISKGAHAIGQREKRWLCCDAGLPFFPTDFPDCNAYSDSTLNEAKELEEKAQRRPLAVRPFKIPVPSPWNSLHVTRSIRETSFETFNPNLFDGIVARTSDSLTNFLQSFKNNNNKLCLVRVLLHAFKEGSFEEGAVICAPSLTDISLLNSSEGEERRVAMSQSSVSSYFLQEEEVSGTWKLNVSEESVANQSHRWPIGFITTGFVRGSKKAIAGGFCDAVLLERLRDEQWRGKDVKRKKKEKKKEVYVLVRNLRSCAYRLALANIVLEQQESSDVYCF